jgi:single-strand DNA-binding protein
VKKLIGKGGEKSMQSVNKVILIGNLTRDPEIRQTDSKKAVCTFGLATNRNWIAKNGKKQEQPEFHSIVAWDKLAVTCQTYLTKGRLVYVEGRIQSHTYTGQDGGEKTGVEVVLEKLAILDPMPKGVREALDFQSTQ